MIPSSTRVFFLRFLIISLASLMLSVLLVIIGVFVTEKNLEGKIFPRTRIGEFETGGLTPGEASLQLIGKYTYAKEGKIILTDGDRQWLFSPFDLGLIPDLQNTVMSAFSVGREGILSERLFNQFRAWTMGSVISPLFLFDQNETLRQLQKLEELINRPVIEANLSLNGPEVVITPGETGRRLDVEASLKTIAQQILKHQDGIVPLVIRETEPGIMDASNQANLIRQILGQPFTFEEITSDSVSKPMLIDPNILASLISIQKTSADGKTGFQISLNRERTQLWLTQNTANTQISPENARFVFNDSTRRLDLISPAIIGKKINLEKTFDGFRQALEAGTHKAVLVFDSFEPEITDKADGEKLGIKELVRAETSFFYGSNQERIQNITAAAARFHGLMVAPGETFSMVQALGDISLDNGYAEALIIYGDQTIKGVGGGVCQVSTTLFRTAFFAGYPIIERHAHAYRVSYYEKIAGNQRNPELAGLDATVYAPLVDFKFKNDTPYWLLMETYVNPAKYSITWKFYSTNDGRKVEWTTTGPQDVKPAPPPTYKENPELTKGEIRQVDWDSEGAEVLVHRKVLQGSQVILEDDINTKYEPWKAVFEYGPGTENMPPPEEVVEGTPTPEVVE